MPVELKDQLLQIALSTDCVAIHDIDPWRESAICAARWLIRTAAVAKSMPQVYPTSFKSIMQLCERLNDKGVAPIDEDTIALAKFNGIYEEGEW